ncbi:hypothetical protein J2Z69_003539 [Paenibacillus shirakamiensis]|uniref:Uncharacterized protein n=1 Tax=Paenibacillus shirakamiensis TaxID=1265935 RepID=A0ABS4JN72_9BACL|nr:hypothetical protein [Paenibacillus shirakamiensis]MBP2002466.1 hypothetical protein [Paenibacillus shirakamiensis]
MSPTNPKDEQEEYTRDQIKEAKEGNLPKSKDINEAENGSMVNDMDDLKRLGKEMENMDTTTEVEEKGLKNDPEQ